MNYSEKAPTVSTAEPLNVRQAGSPHLRSVLVQAGFSGTAVVVGNCVAQALEFAANATAARRLGPSAFGFYAFAFSYAAFFSALVDFGLNSILVREITSTPYLTQTLVRTVIQLKLVLVPIAYLVALGTAFVAGYSTTAVSLVAVSAISVVGLAFSGVGDAGFAAQLDMRRPALLKVGGRFTGALGVSLVGLWSNSPRTFALAWLPAFLLPGLSLLWLRRLSPLERTHAHEAVSWQRMMAEAWPIGVAGLCVMLYTKFDIMLLARVLSSTETGYYAAAARVNEVAYGVATALMVSVYPLLVRFRDTNRFPQHCRFGLGFMGGVGFFLVVGVFGTGSLLIPTLFGAAYARSASLMSVLVLGQPMAGAGLFIAATLTALGRQRVTLEATVLAAAWNIAANLLLVASYGASGAAWANVTSLAIPILYPLFRPRVRWLSLLAVRELGSAGTLALLAVLVGRLLPAGAVFGIGRALLGLCCFGVFLAAANARQFVVELRCLRSSR